MLKKRITDLQSQKDAEKEWWDSRKKTIEADLMAELETDTAAEGKKAPSRTSDDDTVLVESGGPTEKGQSGAKGKKKEEARGRCGEGMCRVLTKQLALLGTSPSNTIPTFQPGFACSSRD